MQWLLSKPLKGWAEDEFDIPTYENVQDEGAEIGQGFKSSTLVPNVVEIKTKDGKKYSLLDMAGYQDSRDYIGIITVAYMLKAVLDKIQKLKFIVVLNASTI